MNTIKRSILFSLVAVFLLVGVTATAFADDSTGNLTLEAGAFTYGGVDAAITFLDSVTGLNVVLNGASHTALSNDTFQVADHSGAGAGWKVSAALGAAFTDGTHTIDTLRVVNVTGTNLDGNPTGDTINANNLAVTGGAAAVDIFSTPADSGMGDNDVLVNWSLTIPAAAYAGDYDGTITITAVQLP